MKIIKRVSAICLIALIIFTLTGCGESSEILYNYSDYPIDTYLRINGNIVNFGDNINNIQSQNNVRWDRYEQTHKTNVTRTWIFYCKSAKSHTAFLTDTDILDISANPQNIVDKIDINVKNLDDTVKFTIGDYEVTKDTKIEDIGQALNRDISAISTGKLLYHIDNVYLTIHYDRGDLIITEEARPDKPQLYDEVATSGEYHDNPVYTINNFYPNYLISDGSYKMINFMSNPSDKYIVGDKSVYFVQDGKQYFKYSTNSKTTDKKGNPDYNTMYLNISEFDVQKLPADKIYKIGTYVVSNKTTFDELKQLFNETDNGTKLKGSLDNYYYFVELQDGGIIHIKGW